MRMKLRWVRRLPVLLVESQHLVFPGMASLCLGHLIFVKPRAWNAEPLIRHELQHVDQMVGNLYVGYLVRWLLSERFRLWSEVEAYRTQLSLITSGAARDEMRDRLATSLAEKYHGVGIYRIFPIRITFDRARTLLMMCGGSPI